MYKIEKSLFLNTCMYYFMKFLGLCPFTFDKKILIKFSYFGMFYNISIIVLYSWFFSIAITLRYKIILFEETPLAVIIDSISCIFVYSTIVSSWLTFIFRYKTLQKIFDGFKTAEDLENKLHISQPKNKIKKALKITRKHIIIVDTLVFVFMSSAVIVVSFCQDMQRQSTFWFIYNIITNVFFNVAVLLCEIMILLRKHYRMLNKKILSLFRSRNSHYFIGKNFNRALLTFPEKVISRSRRRNKIFNLY